MYLNCKLIRKESINSFSIILFFFPYITHKKFQTILLIYIARRIINSFRFLFKFRLKIFETSKIKHQNSSWGSCTTQQNIITRALKDLLSLAFHYFSFFHSSFFILPSPIFHFQLQQQKADQFPACLSLPFCLLGHLTAARETGNYIEKIKRRRKRWMAGNGGHMMFNAFPVVGGHGQLERRGGSSWWGRQAGSCCFRLRRSHWFSWGQTLSLFCEWAAVYHFAFGNWSKERVGNNNCNSNTISPPPKNSLKGPAKNYQIYVERRY